MKRILTILFTFFILSTTGQDTKPTGTTFKNLQSPSFSYWLNDSSVWIYKGSTYGWTQLSRKKYVDSKVSSEAYSSSWGSNDSIAPSKSAIYNKIESLGTGGGLPAGTGSQIQFRSNDTTFGAVTGSSVSGANVTLGGKLSMDYSSTDWMGLFWNRHATSALGFAILAGQSDQQRSILVLNSSQGDNTFEALSNGQIFMPRLSNATADNVIYYNSSTGLLTYGTSGGGGGTSRLTTKGDLYTYSTGDTRLPVGTNGQVLSANSTKTTGLEWINPPSGSSIWTDGGTYAHLNGYEDIYMPRGKSLSWRSTTTDATGTNSFRITPADATNLRIYAGSGDHEVANFYNNNQAGLSVFSLKGLMNIDLGGTSTYESDAYSVGSFAANGYTKLGITGMGTIAQAARSSSPSTPASGWGYWYSKTDGKPYFKNSSGTEFDLSASGSGGGMTNPMTTGGDIIYGGASGTATRLGAGSNGQVLTLSSGIPSWQNASTGFANPMTTRGDIIYQSSTGTARLGRGTTGQILTSDGTDIGWSTYTGSSGLVTVGTISSGTWSGTAIAANKGGTGQTSYAVGDILYASASGTLSKLSPGTAGYLFQTNGSGNAPSWEPPPTGGGMVYPGAGFAYSSGSSWGTSFGATGSGSNVVLNTSPTITRPIISGEQTTSQAGQIGYASGIMKYGTGTVIRTIATTDGIETLTNKTISGASNTLTVRLANDVSGTLPVGNGGTGQTGYAVGDILYASGTSTLAKRPIGTEGQVLKVSSGLPVWAEAGGGWTDRGTVIALADTTDRVVIGGPDLGGTEALYINTTKNHGVRAFTSDTYGEGVIGIASAFAGTGVFGSGHSYGLYANASGSTGRNYGGYFIANASTDGIGIYLKGAKAHMEIDLTISAPASASAAGTKGDVIITPDHIYVCTATNTWKRVAISTW